MLYFIANLLLVIIAHCEIPETVQVIISIVMSVLVIIQYLRDFKRNSMMEKHEGNLRALNTATGALCHIHDKELEEYDEEV